MTWSDPQYVKIAAADVRHGFASPVGSASSSTSTTVSRRAHACRGQRLVAREHPRDDLPLLGSADEERRRPAARSAPGT